MLIIGTHANSLFFSLMLLRCQSYVPVQVTVCTCTKKSYAVPNAIHLRIHSAVPLSLKHKQSNVRAIKTLEISDNDVVILKEQGCYDAFVIKASNENGKTTLFTAQRIFHCSLCQVANLSS